MLNKFALKEVEMIRLIAERGREQDAYAAGARFIDKAGASNADREARRALLVPFLPRLKGKGTPGPENVL